MRKKIIRLKNISFFLLVVISAGCEPKYEIPPPFIKYISPESGKVGSQVTLIGTSLDGTTEAWINVSKAQILGKPTSTHIVIIVPIGAKSGKIKISKGGVSGISLTDFIVIAP